MIQGIHHASLLVGDTRKSLDFYQGVLGISVCSDRPQLGYPGAWLSVGRQQLHLLELPNPDSPEGRPDHGGRDRHVALWVSDLQLIAERLDAAGVAYSRSRSGRRALFCRDPDANALEFIEL